jgi:hypothetical protein
MVARQGIHINRTEDRQECFIARQGIHLLPVNPRWGILTLLFLPEGLKISDYSARSRGYKNSKIQGRPAGYETAVSRDAMYRVSTMADAFIVY